MNWMSNGEEHLWVTPQALADAGLTPEEEAAFFEQLDAYEQAESEEAFEDALLDATGFEALSARLSRERSSDAALTEAESEGLLNIAREQFARDGRVDANAAFDEYYARQGRPPLDIAGNSDDALEWAIDRAQAKQAEREIDRDNPPPPPSTEGYDTETHGGRVQYMVDRLRGETPDVTPELGDAA